MTSVDDFERFELLKFAIVKYEITGKLEFGNTIDELEREYEQLKEQIIKNQEDAEAYNRLLPWIFHVMDCYECHKKGTDICNWTRNKLKKDAKIVEIIVLPDTIEEAQKALDDMK